MNRISLIICPMLLRATRKSTGRSDPALKLKYRPRNTSTTQRPQLFRITYRTCATHTHHHNKHESTRISQDGPIIRAYQELIQRGEYRLDPAQLYTLQLLQGLADDIHRYVQQVNTQPEEQEPSSGWWARVKCKSFPFLAMLFCSCHKRQLQPRPSSSTTH